MALFSKSTKKEAKPKAAAKGVVVKDVVDSSGKLETVLMKPWLSEKALIGTEKGVYVFEVPKTATKTQISAAITKIYKVTPRRVNIVNLPAKRKPMRRKRGYGMRAAHSKAYVFLKKGETIQFA